MENIIVKAGVYGLIAGLIVGITIRYFPIIHRLIPDGLNGMITGIAAGGVAMAVYIAANKKKNL